MATKKKTEDTQVVEAVTSEAKTTKKSTTKKSTSTKKKTEKKVEEPVAEEVKAEDAQVVEEPEVEEVKALEPEKKVEKVEEVKKDEPTSNKYRVGSGTGLYTFKGPGLDKPKGKPLSKGAVIRVSERKGNWGKIGEDRWVLMGPTLIQM